MDYSALSDFDVNCEVLSIIHPDINHMCLSGDKSCFYDCGPTGDGWHQIDIPDYCNNPADAWPVIVKNGISLYHNHGSWQAEMEYSSPIGAFGTDEICSKFVEHKNPLRAAMVVFLMMQEGQ